MRKRNRANHPLDTENGSVLLIVSFGMIMLLAVCAFSIDLANFYLSRAQAQRAADAAALAGATAFVDSGCITGGCTSGGPQEVLATQQAEAAGDQNYIAGKLVNIQDSDVTFSYPTPSEPQVTVFARRAVPTFFAKIFGIQTANISASATAEAYTPSGGGNSPIGPACLKPFLIPNCDPDHATSPMNSSCGSTPEGYFIDPNNGAVLNPGAYSAGIQGETWRLHSNAGPSQWYLVGFTDAPPSSGSALTQHILQCTPGIFSCGTTLVTANGKMVGPVAAIDTMIGANGYGPNQGQDTINTTMGPPFQITGGMNNPNPALRGQTFTDYTESPSVVTLPVYSGGALAPGGSVVRIDGYLQVFIVDANHQGQDDYIDVVILNGSSCSGDPSNTGSNQVAGNAIPAPAGSPVPIRLIRTN